MFEDIDVNGGSFITKAEKWCLIYAGDFSGNIGHGPHILYSLHPVDESELDKQNDHKNVTII